MERIDGIHSKKKGLKTETKNGLIYMTNSHREQVIVQLDDLLQPHLDKNHLILKDLIYGRWSEMSESQFYQDLIVLIKT